MTGDYAEVVRAHRVIGGDIRGLAVLGVEGNGFFIDNVAVVRIGYVEYDRRLFGEARVVYLRKDLR
jgi:hypothetical protein